MRCYQIISFLIVLFLNTFVLVLLLKFKKLCTLSFTLALQIVLLNLVNSLIFTIDISANQWLFGEYICVMVGALHFIKYLARIVLMLVFVIDHCLTVFVPFAYPCQL